MLSLNLSAILWLALSHVLSVIVSLFHPVSRLEEREAELKKEYNALHQRHTEVCWSGVKICGKIKCFMSFKYSFPTVNHTT